MTESLVGEPARAGRAFAEVERRTRLLVSVRDADEALVAVEAGVDLIDIKEPSHGSLGAARDSVVREVVAAVAGRLPVSMALGELVERDGAPAEVPGGIAFAKMGLAGMERQADWPRRWDEALAALAGEHANVAVAYADWREADAPPREEVLREGQRLGCRAALVDTWRKDGRSLVEHWDDAALRDFVAAANARGMLAVLAGSLRAADFPRVLRAKPDVVAVRGAACGGSRDSSLDRASVERLARLVRGA